MTTSASPPGALDVWVQDLGDGRRRIGGALLDHAGKVLGRLLAISIVWR